MNGEGNVPIPRKSTKRLWIGIACLFALYFFCVMPNVLLGVLYTVLLLLLGWILFLLRASNGLRVDGLGIAIGMIALGLFVIGLHFARRRFFPARPVRLWQTTRCVLGAVALCVSGICLVGLGHEVSWAFRSQTPWLKYDRGWDIGNRIRSKNNLKQIALGLHNYADAHLTIPEGGHFRPDGTAEHGWMTAMLPYLDQANIYEQIHLQAPWYAAVNKNPMRTRIDGFEHPKIDRNEFPQGGYAPASYSANQRVMNANFGLSFSEVTDGLSNTVFAGEVKQNLRPWGDASNWRNLELGINQSPNGFGSASKGGAHLLMMDGSVRFVTDGIAPHILQAIATPDEGDVVEDF